MIETVTLQLESGKALDDVFQILTDIELDLKSQAALDLAQTTEEEVAFQAAIARY